MEATLPFSLTRSRSPQPSLFGVRAWGELRWQQATSYRQQEEAPLWRSGLSPESPSLPKEELESNSSPPLRLVLTV